MFVLNQPSNATVRQFLGAVQGYARAVGDMWPSFWVKAAAVNNGELWQLCYFALIGRWSEATTAEPVWEQGKSLVALSKQLGAAEAWRLLDRLVSDGTIELAPSILAHVPDVTVYQTEAWQVTSPPIGHTIADVVEEAQWRWLHYYLSTQWLADWPSRTSVDKSIFPDLQWMGLSSYQLFINTYFGSDEQRPNDPGVEMFQLQFDLPLALRVSPGIPDPSSHMRPVTLAVRAPFTLDKLVVTSGNRPSSVHPQIPITDVLTTQDGWTSGTVTIPMGHGKLWLAHPPLMYRRLLYTIPLPTTATQVASTLAYIYAPKTFAKNPKKGAEVWKSDLLTGQNHQLEIALVNALARFGIPILFSGQFQKDIQPLMRQGANTSTAPTAPAAGQPKASGPATPGFDLIAIDPGHKRAVLISAKGVNRSPGDSDIENLLKGVGIVSRLLDGWFVTGLIACHASATILVRVRARDDIVVWGQDELEALLTADTSDEVGHMLWVHPAWQHLGVFRGPFT